MKKQSIAILIILFSSRASFAYELETHAKLSDEAVNASTLSKEKTTLTNLGLHSVDDQRDVFPNSREPTKPKTIRELIQDGARFEDSGTRPLNHFYNPLTGKGLAIGFASPDWALEDKIEVNDQEFSYKRARQYLYDALTKTNPTERDQNFGKTFQTLGHVVHHIQDMAQPQHVRSDLHCDAVIPCKIPGALLGLDHPSLYEKYTDRLEVRNNPSLVFDGYASLYTDPNATVFATPRKLWRTSPEDQSDIDQGMGIAEYTNRNFVSAGTNFDKPSDFPFPKLDLSTALEEDIQVLCAAEAHKGRPCLTPDLTGKIIFYGSAVKDRFRPAENKFNPRTSSQSIFDPDLTKAGKTPVFSLNRFNFNVAHEFLIPRAVAYSAGLIDYFFRGRLDAVDAAFSSQGITLKVKNAIDPKGVWSKEIMKPTSSGGKPSQLVVTYDYQDESGHRLFDASNPVNLTEDLRPGGPASDIYTFTFPASLPDNLDPALTNFRLVYRGALGQEDDAVAVGVFKVVSGFLVQPDYLPQDGIIGPRLIYRHNGQWRLSKAAGLTAGNTDWKGWYVDGKPTKVLSWTGHESRYFPQHSPTPGGDPFRFEIYQNGELFAITPAQVLGAAIMKDSDKNEWLIAICKEGKRDVVYRRPNKKSESMDLYNTELNPEGWKEIGRFLDDPNKDFEPDMPWLFNGDGTEAQTMRRWREPADTLDKIQTKRLMITIENDTANIVNRGNLGGFLNQLTCTSPEASMNQTNTRFTSGEYIIAVDYKDKEEVLARVSLNYNQVSALEGVKDSFSSYTLTFRDTETLHWGGTSITYFTSNNELSAIAGAGRYSDRRINRYEEIRSLFFFDLRYDMLVRGNLKSNDDISISSPPPSFTNYSTDNQESTTIVSNLGSDIEAYSYHDRGTIPPFPPSEGFAIVSIDSTLICVQGTFRSYGTVFSGTSGVGGFWAIDNGGNLFVAQRYYDVDRNLKPFSYLTNGKLEQAIPPGSNDGNYFAIGLVK